MERRLTAILAADVVGFSRLTEADEEGTLVRLKAIRAEVIEPKISENRGRIVKLMGDGLLAEFASVVDAARCALEIQRSLALRNKEHPESEPILFRIGINLGDIILDDDDIYGDGVNVAARLESLATPGGICISGTAFDHVKTKLDAGFERLREQRLKNIREPVRVYRVMIDGKPHIGLADGAPLTRKIRSIAAPAAAAAILVAIFLIWQTGLPRMETASVEQSALALLDLPDKPSIAVLPFTNISDDPEQEYFADGITEDLITDLSKIPGLFVIARNSSFTYKEKPTDLRRVADELGVRYVLEGSVRRAGERVRINAQLIEAVTGTHLWAERYDGELSNIFSLQDLFTEQIVHALAVNLSPSELARGTQAETSNQKAYDAFLRGWAYYRRNTPEDFASAIPFFEQAIGLDPAYGRAHAALAAIYWQAAEEKEKTGHTGVWLGNEEMRRRGNEHLDAAMMDPTPLAHQVAAGLRIRQGRFEDAIAEARRAIELDPNDPAGHEALGKALIYAGRPSEGASAVRQAIRLDPNHSAAYLLWFGLAKFGQEDYAGAAATLREVLQRSPDEDAALILLLAALGHLGELEEAQSTYAVLNDLRQKRQNLFDQRSEALQAGVDSLLVGPYTLKDADFWPYKKQADRERLRRGLRLAGVPADSGEGLSPISVEGATTVDAAEAKKLHDGDAIFVDVRTLEVWKLGHVPGAKLLDLKTDFTEQKLSALADRNRTIVIYCEGPKCLRSSEACIRAVSWGFKNVHYFRAGFPAWRAAGYPIDVK